MSSSSIFDNLPAGPPPPGVKSNFVNPSTQGPLVVALAAVFTSLATVLTLVRLYVRYFLTRSLGWDDFFCALAVIVSWLHSALLINATHLGYGTHIWDIRVSTLLSASNVRWISSESIAYPVAIMFVKVSILLLYYRIFQVNKRFRSAVIGTIICVSLVYTGYTIYCIISAVQCVAFAAEPVCKYTYQIQLSSSAFSVATDFWLLLLPVPLLFGLHLDRQRKIGLIAVFGTGAITCILSLARCIYLGLTFKATDTLWTAALSSELTLVELNVAIMVACAPALPRFYTTVKEFSSSTYHSLLNRSSRTGTRTSRRKPTSVNSDESSRAHELPSIRQGNMGHYSTQVTSDSKNTTVTSRPML